MSNSCKDCQQSIDWNKIAREKLNTRRPLNPDGSIHSCNIRNQSSSSKPVPEPNDYPNPITPSADKISAHANLDLNNLAVIKVLVAALQEYITIKEHGQ